MADFNILTVCSGNICRSPLMELLLRQRLTKPGYVFASAGIIAQPGWHMPPETQQTAVRLRVPPEAAAAHVARRVDEFAIASADLVLTATREHRAAVVALVPKATKYAFTLFEFERLVEAFDEETCDVITASELVDRAHRARTLLRPIQPEVDDLEDPIMQPQAVHDLVGDQIAVMINTISGRLGSTRRKREAVPAVDVEPPARPPINLTFPKRRRRSAQTDSPDAPVIG